MNTKNHPPVSYLVAVAATLSLGLVSSDVLAEATKKLPEELPKMVKGVKVQFKSTARPVAKLTKVVPDAVVAKAKAAKALLDATKVTPEQANTAMSDLQTLFGLPSTWQLSDTPTNQTAISTLGLVKADKVYLKTSYVIHVYYPDTKKTFTSDYTAFIPLKDAETTVLSTATIKAKCKNDTACLIMSDGSLKKEEVFFLSAQSAPPTILAIIQSAGAIALNTLTRFANDYKAP